MFRTLVLVVVAIGFVTNENGTIAFSTSRLQRSPCSSYRLLEGAGHSTHVNDKSKLPFALSANYRDMDDLTFVEEDGTSIRIRVKDIDREWEGGKGSMSVDLFLPDGKVEGCAFFMHGFSQYPKAYRTTLKRVSAETNIAIIAVETGVTSSQVLGDVKAGVGEGKGGSEYCLQRAVAMDTLQCIDIVKSGQEPFAEYIDKKLPLGLLGHSMGGGMCFFVAAQSSINYVACLAPAIGVDSYNPETQGLLKFVPDHSMLVAGSWDFITRPGKVERLSALANDAKRESSLYVEVARGLHTGFQDFLVIFDFKFLTLGWALAFLAVLNVFEVLLIYLVSFLRTNTGQLEGSRTLLVYFFSQMVANKGVAVDDAQIALDNDPDMIKKKWIDKFTIKYGEKK